jgi:hypothetical protein
MHIDWQNVINVILLIILGVVRFVNRFEQKIGPILQQAEQAMLDGKIDKSERRNIATGIINDWIATRKIKLNFISRFFLDRAIDYLAGRLPDIVISQQAKSDVQSLIAETKRIS